MSMTNKGIGQFFKNPAAMAKFVKQNKGLIMAMAKESEEIDFSKISFLDYVEGLFKEGYTARVVGGKPSQEEWDYDSFDDSMIMGDFFNCKAFILTKGNKNFTLVPKKDGNDLVGAVKINGSFPM